VGQWSSGGSLPEELTGRGKLLCYTQPIEMHVTSRLQSKLPFHAVFYICPHIITAELLNEFSLNLTQGIFFIEF
jgi:hypothetical protein